MKDILKSYVGGGSIYVRVFCDKMKYVYESASDDFLALLHYSREEYEQLVNEGRVDENIYSEDLERVRKEIFLSANDGMERIIYLRLVDKEGNIVWVLCANTFEHAEGSVLLKCILMDVSRIMFQIEKGKENHASDERMDFFRGYIGQHTDLLEEIVDYSFSVLEGENDLTTAVSMIMANVGKYFNLCYVTLRWIDEKKSSFELTNQWNDSLIKDEPPSAYVFSKEVVKECKNVFAENGVLVSNGNYSEIIKSYLDKWYVDEDIAAFIQCPVYEGKSIVGVMSFVSTKKNRKWKKKEIKIFQLVARIISAHTMGSKTESEINEKVKRITSYDSLTGLLTLSEFKIRGQRVLEENKGKRNIALIYSDFTSFKNINDTLGLEEGDNILKAFADYIGYSDTTIAATRDYADNMLSLIYFDKKEQLIDRINGKNEHFCAEQNKKHPEIDFKISSGGYIFDKGDKRITDGIDNANIARKIVKKEKMNGFLCFEQSMLDEIQREIKIASDFKTALVNEELLVYLQPQVDIQTEKMAGAEALVRWRKQDGQFVFPDQFVPVIEKNGSIVELDFYMLERVLQFLVKWKEKGAELFPLSVNFSRIHLYNPEFAKNLYARVEAYGVDPKYIDVEITESVFVNQYERVVENLNYLREKGIAVSIDDFGTGYSSLNVLTQVEVDAIKIDKNFLAGVEDSYATRCVVEYMIDLAEKLNLGIVCEGVETENQLDILKCANCKVVQGYYYDRPIEMGDFEEKYMIQRI